jgi:hypothetical protein
MRRRLILPAAFLLASCAKPAIAPTPAVAPTVVPIRIVNNHVHLLMTAAGREIPMIYDTGAGVSLLDIPIADAIGMKRGGKVNLGGAGTNPVRAFAIDGNKTIALPQDTAVKVKPVVEFEMFLAAYEGIPVSGILGADFTRQFVVQLDYANERMILHPRSFQYSGNGIRLPLTFKEWHPHTPGLIVLADSSRIAADCQIDVGASAALALTRPFVQKNGLLDRVAPTIRRRTGRGVGGSSWATIGRIARLQLGTAELKEPVTSMYGDSAGVMSASNFDCNVGGEVLRRFMVYLDYGRKEMILEPLANLNEPFEGDMSGAAFRVDSAAGGVRISDLMPRGPAEAAGLREEDLILSIDGRPAIEYGLEALRRRFRRVGGEVELKVQRGQDQQVIRVPVRRLV